jgi:hypothetical protein
MAYSNGEKAQAVYILVKNQLTMAYRREIEAKAELASGKVAWELASQQAKQAASVRAEWEEIMDFTVQHFFAYLSTPQP